VEKLREPDQKGKNESQSRKLGEGENEGADKEVKNGTGGTTPQTEEVTGGKSP